MYLSSMFPFDGDRNWCLALPHFVHSAHMACSTHLSCWRRCAGLLAALDLPGPGLQILSQPLLGSSLSSEARLARAVAVLGGLVTAGKAPLAVLPPGPKHGGVVARKNVLLIPGSRLHAMTNQYDIM